MRLKYVIKPLISVLLLIGIILPFSPFSAYAQDTVTHVVQPGENLYRIALRYGVSMDAIIAANNIENPRRIFSGQELVIPGLSSPVSSTEVVNPLVASTPTIHVVQPGETLGSIAKQYNIPLDQLILANNIADPNHILRGQELKVWTVENTADAAAIVPEEVLSQPETVEPAAPTTVHIVQPGEHLAQIAQKYGVSWPVIAQMNNIADPNLVYSGQELIIPALNNAGGVTDLGIFNVEPAAPALSDITLGTGKQIVVDLSDSRAYAYENGQLVRNVLASTGLPGTPTVQGDFSIYVKYEAQTMAGPGYYLPDVPWVLYFYKGYSLHGTYWHSNFGQPMSHGCVNLPTEEAKWFYDWAPVGTPVHVQY
jgi:LysM repeat protein